MKRKLLTCIGLLTIGSTLMNSFADDRKPTARTKTSVKTTSAPGALIRQRALSAIQSEVVEPITARQKPLLSFSRVSPFPRVEYEIQFTDARKTAAPRLAFEIVETRRRVALQAAAKPAGNAKKSAEVLKALESKRGKTSRMPVAPKTVALRGYYDVASDQVYLREDATGKFVKAKEHTRISKKIAPVS